MRKIAMWVSVLAVGVAAYAASSADFSSGAVQAIIVRAAQKICLDQSCTYYISESGDSKCTGTVDTAAVTCNGRAGVITDDGTDITNAQLRAAITVTNALVSTSSVIHVTACSAPDIVDAGTSALVLHAVAGAGSFVLYGANAGAVAHTSVPKYCFIVR